jgi:hypothetical protein
VGAATAGAAAWSRKGRRQVMEPSSMPCVDRRNQRTEEVMRYGLLWLLGVPIPILILIWMFGGLN